MLAEVERYTKAANMKRLGQGAIGQIVVFKKTLTRAPTVQPHRNGDPDTRRKATEHGAAGLLTKPIDFVALRQEIDTRLEQAT